jgi:hypothetical protein
MELHTFYATYAAQERERKKRIEMDTVSQFSSANTLQIGPKKRGLTKGRNSSMAKEERSRFGDTTSATSDLNFR